MARQQSEGHAETAARLAATGTTLHGLAASGGVTCGIARIIHNPEEIGRLEAGEIAIAPFADPSWTLQFPVLVGLVLEAGGILSCGAVLAREYGIPAVMLVGEATQMIPDGAVITVDGNRGLVFLPIES